MAGPAADPAALLSSPGPWAPWLLLAAHVSVGLLAAGWLRHGERALGRLLRAVAAFAFRPLLLTGAAVAVAGGAAERVLRSVLPGTGARTRFPAHSVGRRGPPVPGAFASA